MLIFNWKSYPLYVSNTINYSSIGKSNPHEKCTIEKTLKLETMDKNGQTIV